MARYFAALLCLGFVLSAQQPRMFPQPAPFQKVTVAAIPGIVAAGAEWKQVWQGMATADGIAATSDGGILSAQEQTNTINKLDKNDQFSVFLKNPHGPGAVAIGRDGKIYSVERTCTDPGGKPDECKEPTDVAVLTPGRKILAAEVNGKPLGRVNDLVISRGGHIYFTSGGLFHLNPQGKVSEIGTGLRTNGVMLSTDDKRIYVTNGPEIVVFDIQADGAGTNQRTFGKWDGGGNGDGLAMDSKDNLYVTTNAGVQVLDSNGKYLGLIPTSRPAITVTISGPKRNLLYVGCLGAFTADGQEVRTGPGVRNVAMTIYKIPLLARGFKGRAR